MDHVHNNQTILWPTQKGQSLHRPTKWSLAVACLGRAPTRGPLKWSAPSAPSADHTGHFTSVPPQRGSHCGAFAPLSIRGRSPRSRDKTPHTETRDGGC